MSAYVPAKTALITGANAGIGKDVARQLALRRVQADLADPTKPRSGDDGKGRTRSHDWPVHVRHHSHGRRRSVRLPPISETPRGRSTKFPS